MGIKSNVIVGIELDSHEIRAVELKGNKKKTKLSALGRLSLPEGLVKEGKILDPQALSLYLEKLWKESGFKSKEVLLGINNQDLIVRFASFPKVPEDKIAGMIQFQAQDFIPVPLDELELDYIVMGDRKTEEGEFLLVILVAARKKMLNDFITAFALTGLNVREIDSCMLAMGRLALLESLNGTFVLAGYNRDIGNVLIFKEGLLIMARTIAFPQPPLWTAAVSVDNALFNELRSSLNYSKAQSNQTIDTLYLMGSGRDIREEAARLSSSTGLQAHLVKPDPLLEAYSGSEAALPYEPQNYQTCFSLAKRGLDG